MNINKLKAIVYLLYRSVILFFKITLLRKNKMIFLFCSPFHHNMGDHAQTFCIQQWYKSNYPEYEMLILQSSITTNWLLGNIRRFIRKNDLLVCHSGYHLTNLYDEQRIYFYIIRHFQDYPILIFPQTINYTTAESLNEARIILNSHPNLTILCRDEKSYATAIENFPKANLLLYPDIVTSLIGTKQFSFSRNGILFCVRDDKEAYYNKEQIDSLRAKFGKDRTSITDTTRNDFSVLYLYKHRGEALEKVLNEFAHYKLVITDRYHGTIFSMITNTPVVVIGSTDHKLSSGVKWFPKDLFDGYITFANDLDEAYEEATNILNNYDVYTHKLPAYFKENYYDMLKQKISR